MKKKLFSLVLATAFIIGGVISPLKTEAQSVQNVEYTYNLKAKALIYYYVNGTNVNIRSGPGTEYSSYGQVTKDVAFTSAEQKNGWAKGQIQAGLNKGTIGWIKISLLRTRM